MSRSPARFTQADVSRAVKALIKLGHKAFLQILPDGTFKIGFDDPTLVVAGGLQKKKKIG